jgi:hypothetical protein
MIQRNWLAAGFLCLLAACGVPRLQKPYEAANELSKTNQAQMEARCGSAGQQAIDCKLRVREEFAAQRQKNEQDAR